MPITTLSPKYQLVVPREVRDSMPFRPGQKFEVMFVEGVLEFIAIRPPLELRGIAKGTGAILVREEEERY